MPSAASDSSNEDVEMADSDGCRLPQELMHRILVEACGPPTISRVTVVGRSDTDTDTLLQLSLASKQLYAFATPRLYAWVRLTRPSALKAFQQTLSSRPALGRLVVGLHIGADTSLEKAWWPMATRQGFGGPTFDLNVDEDNDGYPLALTRTGVIFAIDGSSHRPLAAALEAAARCLDVDLCQLGLDRSAREIGSDAWHIRVLEAQAAVELYHLHTKGHEVNNTTYPRLVVSERAPARGGNIFRVTRRDIYMRLTRVGAPTDSFQHPLIFARSGLLWEAKALDNVEHRSSVPACYNEEEDPADVFTWPLTGAAESADEGEEMGEDVKAVPYPADLSDPHDFAIPATATVAGNLALARSLLGLTTCVQSLSLTGIFECSIVGERFGPALPDLRSLTIGPSPNFWGLTLNYGNVTLRPVKRLQICGGFWSGEEIERMSQSGQLVNLREIHWTSLEQYSDGDVDHLVGTFSILINFGHDAPVDMTTEMASTEGEADEESSEEASGGVDGSQSPSQRGQTERELCRSPGSLYIEARLHPLDVDIVLKAAPSEEVAQAWRKGTVAPPFRHRLKLRAHKEFADEEAGMRVLYDEGRKFWEEG